MIQTAPDAMLLAIRDGNTAAVERMLAMDPALVASRGSDGESLVLHAVYHGSQQLIPVLLGGRPLDATEAAALGEVVPLRAAIENDDDLRVRRSSDGWTPLHLAAHFGHVDAVALLIDHGAPLDALSTNAFRSTPLHTAFSGAIRQRTTSMSATASIVRRLILAGADLSIRDAERRSVLHLAAALGDPALCELLLARGAEIDALSDKGETPAMVAEISGHAALARRLSEAPEAG